MKHDESCGLKSAKDKKIKNENDFRIKKTISLFLNVVSKICSILGYILPIFP